MSVLVDTDRIVDYLKGRPDAVTLLDRLYPEGLAIGIISYAEVYEGIYYGQDPSGNELAFRRLLEGIRVFGINRAVARRFALICGQLRAGGQLIPQPDLFIAAMALEHRMSLLTRNQRHFLGVPGLRLYAEPEG